MHLLSDKASASLTTAAQHQFIPGGKTQTLPSAIVVVAHNHIPSHAAHSAITLTSVLRKENNQESCCECSRYSGIQQLKDLKII